MMLVIYGPTAIGKTTLAISLAQKYGGEIISADSRQVYRGLDIGTGKVSFDSKFERHEGFWIVDGIKIHGFDLVNPGEQFTAAAFVKFANDSIIQIIEQNKLPMVVGGTGFYIKALTSGIGTIGIPANPKLRSELEKLSVSELYLQLHNIDKKRALKMNQSDRANPRRLVRAIEIAISSQRPENRDQKLNNRNWSLDTGNYLLLGLTAPNSHLYARADKWLEFRLDHRMINEVKNLLTRKIDPKWFDNLGLEYRWLTRYLMGEIKKDEAVEGLKGDIHDFIRRQKTWFRQLEGLKLFDISSDDWQDQLEKTVKDWYYTDRNGAGTTSKN